VAVCLACSLRGCSCGSYKVELPRWSRRMTLNCTRLSRDSTFINKMVPSTTLLIYNSHWDTVPTIMMENLTQSHRLLFLLEFLLILQNSSNSKQFRVMFTLMAWIWNISTRKKTVVKFMTKILVSS
jgi:hypothetical protein